MLRIRSFPSTEIYLINTGRANTRAFRGLRQKGRHSTSRSETGASSSVIIPAPRLASLSPVSLSRTLPIPTKLSTLSERSRPRVPVQAVHLFRAKPSGLERGS